jgi:hypothetical protein
MISLTITLQKPKSFLVFLIILISGVLNAQTGMGIGTKEPDESSVLDIVSTTKDLLIP